MQKIDIYTQDNCEWCDEAKKEFEKRNWNYNLYDINERVHYEKLMSLLSEVKTVPQIWIDNEHIGGYRELMERLYGLDRCS
jgi:glutaredoxin